MRFFDAVGRFARVWEDRTLPLEDMLIVDSDNSFQRSGIDLVRSVGFFSLISNGENVTNLDFLTSSDYTFAPISFFGDFSS
jgi:hypothetical protein